MGREAQAQQAHALDGKFVVYEILCETPDTAYVGFSKTVSTRLKQHKTKRGARFTKVHGVASWRILGVFENDVEAKRVEGAWWNVLKTKYGRVGGYFPTPYFKKPGYRPGP